MNAHWIPHKELSIETENFKLKTFTGSEAGKKQVSWLNDKTVNKWLNSHHVEHTIDSLKEHISRYDNYNSFHLGIFHKKKNLHIGNFSIVVDHFHKTGEIRVLIGDKNWWGKGVVIECRTEIINWLFYDLNLFKIYGYTISNNVAALFNWQKQGFTCEAVLKKHKLSGNDKRSDVAIFVMYKEDWKIKTNN